MKEGQAARTAQTVAFARAIESQRPAEERLFEDAYARRFLDADGLWVLSLLRRPFARRFVLNWIEWVAPGLQPYAVARTAYIDEVLVAALAVGVSQVVILGAGYDTRGFRIPGIEKATVFEVDHPDTQDMKRVRLGADVEAVGDRVRFVGVDFDRQDFGERLEARGFRFDQRTFFIWEGVTQYITEGAVEATLRTIRRTPSGSEVVFTYAHRALIDGTRSFPGGRRLLLAVRLAGEPFVFGLDPAGVAGYLSERGLDLVEDVGGGDFSARYFRPHGRSDRATETERIAHARVRAQA